MKQRMYLLIVLAVFLVSANSLSAQELTVVYSSQFNIKSFGLDNVKDLPENLRESLEESFASIDIRHNLMYLNGQSVFKMLPFKENQALSIFGVKMDISKIFEEELREVIYKNYNTNELRIRTIDRGKPLLVQDTVEILKFTFVPNATRKILNFDCEMAVSEDNETKIWVTDHFKLSDGPDISANVPGLILAMESKELNIEAKSIEYKVKQTIVPPTGGKKIDFAKYKELKQY